MELKIFSKVKTIFLYIWKTSFFKCVYFVSIILRDKDIKNQNFIVVSLSLQVHHLHCHVT